MKRFHMFGDTIYEPSSSEEQDKLYDNPYYGKEDTEENLALMLSSFAIGMFVYKSMLSRTTLPFWLDTVFLLICGVLFGLIALFIVRSISFFMVRGSRPTWLAFLIVFLITFVALNYSKIYPFFRSILY